MKLRFGICGLALVSGAFAAPQKIGHATRAQIEAVLPASLRVKDKLDRAGEARYARLEALVDKMRKLRIESALLPTASSKQRTDAVKSARPLLAELDQILKGSLRQKPRPDPMDSFPKLASVKSLAKVIGFAAMDAAERKNQTECAFYTILGLRLSSKFLPSGNGLIGFLVAEAVDAIVVRTAVEVDGKGGLDEQARDKVFSLLAPDENGNSEAVNALRREFVFARLPLIVDPVHGADKVFATSKDFAMSMSPKKKVPDDGLVGNYDPIATARLVGRIFDEAIKDLQRPLGKQTGLAQIIVEKAGKQIPEFSADQVASYPGKMDAIPNSIGLELARLAPPESLPEIEAKRATYRNLARAVILLREGKPMKLADPFGKGPLKFDAKRRIVWSVGTNRKDDGGQIERVGEKDRLDIGYRY